LGLNPLNKIFYSWLSYLLTDRRQQDPEEKQLKELYPRKKLFSSQLYCKLNSQELKE
jgi:hypothetical protein